MVKNPCLRTISLGTRSPPLDSRSELSSPEQHDDGEDAIRNSNDRAADNKTSLTNVRGPPTSAVPLPGSLSNRNDRIVGGTTSNGERRAMATSPRLLSYPGLQADPAEVLLNGASMKASFAPPAVRLANFDK